MLTLAQAEAQRFNHDYIGTEHLLLAMMSEGQGIAARALANQIWWSAHSIWLWLAAAQGWTPASR